MKVKDVIDRLQPGMLYQRVHMKGYDKKSDPVVVTGKVMGHNVDSDGKSWIGTIEFYLTETTYSSTVTYLASNVEKVYSFDDEFALLQYSPASIHVALEIAAKALAEKAIKDRSNAEKSEMQATMVNAIYDDLLRSELMAEHRAEEIGRGTLTAREDYDQRVVQAANDAWEESQ